MIYAVHILDGQYVKIGFCSQRIESRIAQLQTGSPFKIKRLFTIDGSIRQEKHLHYLLTEAFKRGGMRSMPPNEWYPGDSKFFLGLLFNLKNSVGMAFSYLAECSPQDTDIEERNRKRLERFIKHNTNPDAVFKPKPMPKDIKAEWPGNVRKIAGKEREMIRILREE